MLQSGSVEPGVGEHLCDRQALCGVLREHACYQVLRAIADLASQGVGFQVERLVASALFANGTVLIPERQRRC